MTSTDIVFKEVARASVQADNSGDTGRAYAISAVLEIERGALSSVSGGAISGMTGQYPSGSFGKNANGEMWLNLNAPEDEYAAMTAAISAFLRALPAKVDGCPVTLG
ncbi:hypothetical protein [uncultured Muribaculum sp.]|uniref:hypothetical protein n=1 Tax=uncultured Muribaculum sp. TaxID=1918613 RepID=UPI00272F94F0|nr:hypothetical protein [uncultured Muribaculum sp.]